ncbi:MAG TPA: TfoX/Sxy family protein [Cellvibrio sp.]|nr:TfoX/Sxy family protein [Cellvibrio sp.]
MTVSNHFILHAVERMSHVVPISYRRIFNGYGVYHNGVQFAIIVNDHLYFRADDLSRNLYLAKKMAAFQPHAVTMGETSFFQLPDEVLSNPSELIHWMRIAVEAAQNAYTLSDEESFTETLVRHRHSR